KGIAVSLSALIDTGAAAYILAGRGTCNPIADHWDLPRFHFEKSITAKGFGGSSAEQLSDGFQGELVARNKVFKSAPILLANFGENPSFDQSL
ncbi:hypothetical protein F4804DRAFT_328125, partial [Jackrogersella minutella]